MRSPPSVVALVALASGLVLGGAAVFAEPPPDMSYQGRLLDPGGQPLTGPVNVQLRVYPNPAPVGGELALYIEDHVGVELRDGIFDVLIGGGAPLAGTFDADLFAEMNRWLEVWVNSERLSPRQPISSVPFAFQASSSDRLGGRGPGDFEPLAVFDSTGRELGPLANVEVHTGVGFCVSGDAENPAGRQLAFLHKPTGMMISTCTLDGQYVSVPAPFGYGFTGPGCTGQAYGPGELAGFAQLFQGRWLGGHGPVVNGVTIRSTGFPGSTTFPDTCTDLDPPSTQNLGVIPLEDLTSRIDLTFPLAAPLRIGTRSP